MPSSAVPISGLINILILLNNKLCWYLPDAGIPFAEFPIFWHYDYILTIRRYGDEKIGAGQVYQP